MVTGKQIGFWYSEYQKSLPHPEDHVDNNIDPELKQKVIDFLDAGERCNHQRGWSCCRICKAINGTAERYHDGYVYPEGLSHYVSEHNVRLPKSFEEHVMGHSVDGVEYDFIFDDYETRRLHRKDIDDHYDKMAKDISDEEDKNLLRELDSAMQKEQRKVINWRQFYQKKGWQ